MKVRTELEVKPSDLKISHRDTLLTIGSCFSQVIGDKLKNEKFNVLVNPFGTIFNPISIINLLQGALHKNSKQLVNTVESQGIWFNYDLHSSFYGDSKLELDAKVEQKLAEVNHHLLGTNTLLITLGTAYVYKLKSTGEIVANCHKVPASMFTKELVNVEEIVTTFQKFINDFKIHNSKFKIILTVSPVRHTKDTIPLNSVSKSILRIACHQLSEQYSEVDYFPSYEIMLDDLRDYRYYKDDLIHPSELAETYIWDKFSEVYFSLETQTLVKEWGEIKSALKHKPFREDSKEYLAFIKNTLEKAEKLKGIIDIEREIELLKGKFF